MSTLLGCERRKVLKPLKAFREPLVRTPEQTWAACMQKGQDLSCGKCRSAVRRARFTGGMKRRQDDPSKHVMYCSSCDTPLEKSRFSKEDQEASEAGTDKDFACLKCKKEVAPRAASTAETHKCTGILCQHVERPYYHFFQNDLSAWKL